MVRKGVCMLFVTSLLLGAPGCREEGPVEKTGRKVDEVVEDLRHGDEGAMERAGRQLDEAAEDLEEKMTEE